MIISEAELESIIHGNCHDPHHLLGIHPMGGNKGIVIRCWDPSAVQFRVIDKDSGKEHSMDLVHPDGLFEVLLKGKSAVFGYQYRSEYENGSRE